MSPLEELLESLQGLAKRLGHPEFKGELAELASMASARIATLEAQIAEAKGQGPVVWMQSDHLNKFERMACGASMMLARCSFKQAQEDWKPLYAAPVPSNRDGWHPISTAPKDGTAILAKLTDSDIPMPVRFGKGKWAVTWDCYPLSEFDGPTHWKPLPAPPAMEDGK